jgi:hypothetical protein
MEDAREPDPLARARMPGTSALEITERLRPSRLAA